MATRTTERRIPPGYNASDLGGAAGDTSATLVSFHSSPIVVGRRQTYVLFVLDAAMQANVETYRWQVAANTTTTPDGTLDFVPDAEGDLQINVDLLGGGGAVVKSLALTQEVLGLNPELEGMIERPDDVAPVAAEPETSRELVNDVRAYIDELAPRNADSASSLNRLIFALAYAEALHTPPADRATQTERLATALNDSASERFVGLAQHGIGLCQIRPQILAMYVGATAAGSDRLITPRELPRDQAARRTVNNDLNRELEALDPALQADLFNLLRFPKANLRMAALLIGALRTQYFPGRDLLAIVGDEDDAKALITQFKEGPLAPA